MDVIYQQLGLILAQALAFLGFLFVLWLFAWRPVLDFLETRRKRIADELDKADRLGQEAQARQAELNERLAKIEDEARKRIQDAVVEGRQTAEAIAEKAREEAKEIRVHAQTMAEIELAKAMQEVKDRVVAMTMLATERLLREEMTGDRQQTLVRRFVEELKQN